MHPGLALKPKSPWACAPVTSPGWGTGALLTISQAYADGDRRAPQSHASVNCSDTRPRAVEAKDSRAVAPDQVSSEAAADPNYVLDRASFQAAARARDEARARNRHTR